MLGDVVLGCFAGLGGLFALLIFGYVLAELLYLGRRRRRERELERQQRRDIERQLNVHFNGHADELDLRERRRIVQRELDRLRR